MSDSVSALHDHLLQLSESMLDSLSKTHSTPPEGTNVCAKSTLQSLLPIRNPNPNTTISQTQLLASIQDFALACALLSSSQSSAHELLSWIPDHLLAAANAAFNQLSKAYVGSGFGELNEKRVRELLGSEVGALVSEQKRVVVELMPEVMPLLKDRIKESSIDKGVDGDEVSAASARAPVGYAILAAYQFRWFVTQVDYPHLGKLCSLVIPCGLTALDHWSPDVKGQGMISFIHLAKNVNAAELGWYEDVILDACCQNIASADEIWHHVVEMSVLLVTYTQRSNPRSPWFERILNEMLGHLERQPRNQNRRIAWLTFIEPLLHGVGLFLLAHFRRIFPLLFQWMHANDDETVLLVLKQLQTVISLTWIRNTPYIERLVDELLFLYKKATFRTAQNEITTNIVEILDLLQKCKGLQFEAAWHKHRDDPSLTMISLSLGGTSSSDVSVHIEKFHGTCLQQG